MGSESDEIIVEDSDDSLLDFKELNDLEFDLPQVAAPSLESILWDLESEEGSDNASLQSFQSMSAKFRSMLCHRILQGISAQLSSAAERVSAGLPTVIATSMKSVAIGTSHGYVLNFNSEQNLCWCCYDNNISDQGAVSALAFNLDSTRLLIGYERGFICMVDASTGDVIRKMSDAHAPQTAVLHLRFTFLNNLALCGDSSGCIFSLSFNRRLGVRSWDSKCLFSGARGEVCVFEPLVHGHDYSFLSRHVLVAMATLSKVIVISIRPRLKVLYSHILPVAPASLPLLAWQLVTVGRHFQPVLAWARSTDLHYTRVLYDRGTDRLRLQTLRTVKVTQSLTALHWLGQRHLALLDTDERLQLVEVRSQRTLETIELTDAGLVYASAHFKALAVGGGVSGAFALAGERACYNSVCSVAGAEILILGTRTVHSVRLRAWPERLDFLSSQGCWAEAMRLAAEEGTNRDDVTVTLLKRYLENLNQNAVDKESLTAAINCCVKLKLTDILCSDLFDAVLSDSTSEACYYSLLADHIISGRLVSLTPHVAQSLITHLAMMVPSLLETVLLSLSINCLDLHQCLKLCKKRHLYDAWIRITTQTLADYTSPLTEFLSELTPDNHKLGNCLLVYVSSCLAGLAYPSGQIQQTETSRVKHEILRCLETAHSVNGTERAEGTYPYMRALLKYNVREFLNVVELAFREDEFKGEMGWLQRQRLVTILSQIVVRPEFDTCQIINVACFIARLITSNNLNSDEVMLTTVMKALTDDLDVSLKLRDHNERQQAWLDLMKTGNLKMFSNDHLLELALKCHCYLVAEYLYNLKQNYTNIIECYLNDDIRKIEVFNYIRNYINEPDRCIQEQFTKHFPELLQIDYKKTCDIVIEHYGDLIITLNTTINDPHFQYLFLKSIVPTDIKIPAELSEQFLDLLCQNDRNQVVSFLSLNSSCRIEQALKITQKHEIPNATALLLEQSGDWLGALKLLLTYDLVDEGVGVCVRGAEHLDGGGAQELWLILLEYHRTSTKRMSLRQLLRSAAAHVPPEQLLDLVADANFGDVKELLQGMMSDCHYDIVTLETCLRMVGRDLHRELARSLCTSSKGISITNITCSLCQKPVATINDMEQSVAIWGCGHCFHAVCFKLNGVESVCPQCHVQATQLSHKSKSLNKSEVGSYIRARPDLEGHF